jgi:hypothetical protein
MSINRHFSELSTTGSTTKKTDKTTVMRSARCYEYEYQFANPYAETFLQADPLYNLQDHNPAVKARHGM